MVGFARAAGKNLSVPTREAFSLGPIGPVVNRSSDGPGEPATRAIEPDPDVAADLRRLRGLSHVLDDSIPVPGTGYRIGVEPLIGLVPVIGDAVGAALSVYVLVVAVRTGVPRATIVRIGIVLWVDATLGAVPVVGDVFDAYWKANRRAVALLEARLADPASAAADRRYLWWAGVGAAGLGAAALLALGVVLRWLLAAVRMVT
jgi:hypothetical protein